MIDIPNIIMISGQKNHKCERSIFCHNPKLFKRAKKPNNIIRQPQNTLTFPPCVKHLRVNKHRRISQQLAKIILSQIVDKNYLKTSTNLEV